MASELRLPKPDPCGLPMLDYTRTLVPIVDPYHKTRAIRESEVSPYVIPARELGQKLETQFSL
jgi:hypothetical protein